MHASLCKLGVMMICKLVLLDDIVSVSVILFVGIFQLLRLGKRHDSQSVSVC